MGENRVEFIDFGQVAKVAQSCKRVATLKSPITRTLAHPRNSPKSTIIRVKHSKISNKIAAGGDTSNAQIRLIIAK
jgi:hypothetical protein